MKITILYVIQILLTGSTFVSYVPQVIKMLRTKQSDDISDSSWIMFSATAILYLIMLILEDSSWRVIAMQVLETFMCLSTLLLSLYYKHKSK